MGRGNHLGEVDHGHMVGVVQHQVELVEVSVDEAVIGQLDDELHDLAVETGRILQLPDLTPRGRRNIKRKAVNNPIYISWQPKTSAIEGHRGPYLQVILCF